MVLKYPKFSKVTHYNAGGDDFYNAEGEIGLSYGVEMGNSRPMIFTLGYRAEGWFGVNNTRSTNAVSPLAGDAESFTTTIFFSKAGG